MHNYIAGNFHLEKFFCLFCPLLSWAKFLSCNFFVPQLLMIISSLYVASLQHGQKFIPLNISVMLGWAKFSMSSEQFWLYGKYKFYIQARTLYQTIHALLSSMDIHLRIQQSIELDPSQRLCAYNTSVRKGLARQTKDSVDRIYCISPQKGSLIL